MAASKSNGPPSPTNSCNGKDKVLQLPDYLSMADRLKKANLGPEDAVNLTHETRSQIKVKHSSRFKENDTVGNYKMDSRPRGYALVVNNIDFYDTETYPTRNGAKNDEKSIKEMLEQLYFVVESHTNKTRTEMKEIVRDFSQKVEFKKVDCIVVVFMSHGEEGHTQDDTKVIGTDGIGLKTNDIVSYFFTDNCPAMVNKPKIFLFQSCRGNLTDPGVIVGRGHLHHRTEYDGKLQNRSQSDSFQSRVRTTSDIFIAYPVAPGRKANRDIYNGAWFIQAIVQVFSKMAYEHHLDDLFKLVDQEIRHRDNLLEANFQAVTITRYGWNKHLYFNPGLHKLDGETIREENNEIVPARGEGMDVVDMIKPKPCQKPKRYERLENNDDDDDHGCCPADKCNPC